MFFLQLDLPFSLTFFRWLLGQEHSLTMADLYHVSPDIHRTLRKMQEIVRQRDAILEDPELSTQEKNEQVMYFFKLITLLFCCQCCTLFT